MRMIGVVVVLSMVILSGCDGGGTPTEKMYLERLERLEGSPGGRHIDKQKELDRFRTLTDGEKVRAYEELAR